MTTSDSKVVKAYIDTITYGSWMIEVTGNGTAEITATLLSDHSIKTSITITVENYPEKKLIKLKQIKIIVLKLMNKKTKQVKAIVPKRINRKTKQT